MDDVLDCWTVGIMHGEQGYAKSVCGAIGDVTHTIPIFLSDVPQGTCNWKD
jgi:hypothetical protein